MTICLINNLYKPFARGGAENVIGTIANGLIKSGDQVIIITTKPHNTGVAVKEEQNLKIFYLPGYYCFLNRLPVFFRLFWHAFDMFDMGIYWQVKRILEQERPNLVITHNLKGLSYLIPRLTRDLGIKHCHYLHDIQLIYPSGLMFYGQEQKINRWLSQSYGFVCRSLFASPNIVISPSAWLLNLHAERGFFKQSKKYVLPNPTPPIDLSPARKINQDNCFTFLFVGQIEKHKGIIYLADAFKKFLQTTNHKAKLVIIGAGAEQGKLAEIIKNQPIELLGKLKQNEVFQKMLAADCLLAPSLCYENSPAVIYEAWQNGLPIIAASIGGIKELLSDWPQLLFQPGNQDELIAKMNWAIANPEELKKISQQGLNKAKNYQLDGYLKKIKEITG